jgi:hypothetical protein
VSSRPAEAERGLAHVGLDDLFEGVLDAVLPRLPPPRRRALEVALLLEDARVDEADARAVGIATRSALELLAADGPLVVAIDDLQWFDAASGDALAFALRRLGGGPSPVLLLVAARSGLRTLSGLERAVGQDRVRRVSIGPLTVGALHRLLRDRFERPFASAREGRPALRVAAETAARPPYLPRPGSLGRSTRDARRPPNRAPRSR